VAARAPRLTGGALAASALLLLGGGVAARAVGEAAVHARQSGAARTAAASTRAFDSSLDALHRSVDHLAVLAPATARVPGVPLPQVVGLVSPGGISGVLYLPRDGGPAPVTGAIPSTVDLAGLALRMRPALELARDTGDPHAAAVEGTVAVAIPVYAGPTRTTDQRRAALSSWVLALVEPRSLLGHATGATESAALTVGGTRVTPEVTRNARSVDHTVTVLGQPWQLTVSPRIDGGAGAVAWTTFALGVLGALAVLLVSRRSSREVARAVASTDALERETRTIAEVGPLLQQSLDLAEVLPAVAVRLSDEFALDGFAVELLGEHGGLVDVFAIGRCRGDGDPVVLVGNDGVAAGAEAAIPLLRAGRTIGRLRLSAKEALAPTQVDALRAAADLIAVATYNVELYEREQGTVRRLQEVDQLKDAFLGTISHELRTPITAIGGFARMLNERYDDLTEEQRRDFLRRIGRNSTSLGMLVDDLLDFARLERQALQTHVSPLPLDIVVAGFASQVVPALGDHGLRTDLQPGVFAMADPRAIERVLANLLTNAAKFSPAGTDVEVSLRVVGEHAEVVVADSGPGIAPEDRLRVFTRFYRGESDVARSTRGAGIGLSVVHELVTQMGGDVEVRGREPHGTAMVVRLPLADATAPAQRASSVVPARSM
jgi:signal transduction histidine kinase